MSDKKLDLIYHAGRIRQITASLAESVAAARKAGLKVSFKTSYDGHENTFNDVEVGRIWFHQKPVEY